MVSRLRCVAVASVCVMLGGCLSASPPPPPRAAVAVVTPAQRLAAVERAAGVDDTELSVQPLHDAQYEDLRQHAREQRVGGDLTGAIGALDQALQLGASDPELLQERAELALLRQDYDGAERWARQALELGSRTGPLCRRHWATIEQARLARAQTADAGSAHAQIDSCTVAGIKRY